MTLLWVLPLLVGIGLLLRRRWRRQRVSHAWLVDDDRRRWTEGQDQVGWKWPYGGDDEAA